MHNYIMAGLLGFCFSALSARYWHTLPSQGCLIMMCGVAVTLYFTAVSNYGYLLLQRILKNRFLAKIKFLPQFGKKSVLTGVSGLLFGTIWMGSVGHSYYQWQLPNTKFHQPVILEGKVEAVTNAVKGQRLLLAVLSVNNVRVVTPAAVRIAALPDMSFAVGQRVRLNVKLRPLSYPLNPGADLRNWVSANRLAAKGEMIAGAPQVLLEPSNSLHYLASSLLHNRHASRWLIALLTGDRQYLTNHDWLLMQATGTAHLFSISGLHVGMVGFWSLLVIIPATGLCCWLVRRPLQRINFLRLSVLPFLILTGVYTHLANWQIPVFRAWLMMIFFIATQQLWVHWQWWQRMVVVLFLCLLFFPFSVMGSSLYLSAGAVIMILFIFWRLSGRKDTFFARLIYIVRVQIVLSMILMPVSLIFFSSVSLLTAAVNIVAIPLISIVVPISLMGLTVSLINGQNNVALAVADTVLNSLIDGLIAVQPFMLHFIDISLPQSASVMALAAIVCFMLPPFAFRRMVSVLLLLPAISYALPMNDTFWDIHVVDVGQGTSIVLQRGEHGILIDTGASFETTSAFTESVVPVLNTVGINTIDTLILSHSDDDHAGGVEAVKAWQNLRGRSVNIIYPGEKCQRTKTLHLEQLTFEFLWPPENTQSGNNHYSCVVRVTDGRHTLLLTGDIDKTAEYALLYSGPETLSADIVIVPHHGSDTSSGQAFVESVGAQYAVFTTGYLNRWQFPDKAVSARYQQQGSELLSTAENGYIRFHMGQKIGVYRYRQDISPKWYDFRRRYHTSSN